MLVLTRKVGEKIAIGDNVVIEVLEMREGRVRLGVTAPKDVLIYRSELLQRLQEDNASNQQAE